MRKILIINRLGIGDVVLTTPIAEILKTSGSFRIGYVVANKAIDLLKNHPYIDDVFTYNKHNKKKVLMEVKNRGYHEAIIVDGRFNSTLFAWQAGCKLLNQGFEITICKQKIFKRHNQAESAIADFAAYSRLMGIEFDERKLKPTIGKPEIEQKIKIDEWLAEVRPKTAKLVLIVARTAADIKNWPVIHLSQFNQYLNRHHIVPVYIGSPADDEYIESIQGNKINVAGKFGLRDLPEIAKHADFALSMCTGPLHILATTDIPIIALYGPSAPKRWAPRTAIVVQSERPCVPCSRWDECVNKPGGTCMESILPERVERIIEENHLLG